MAQERGGEVATPTHPPRVPRSLFALRANPPSLSPSSACHVGYEKLDVHVSHLTLYPEDTVVAGWPWTQLLTPLISVAS